MCWLLTHRRGSQINFTCFASQWPTRGVGGLGAGRGAGAAGAMAGHGLVSTNRPQSVSGTGCSAPSWPSATVWKSSYANGWSERAQSLLPLRQGSRLNATQPGVAAQIAATSAAAASRVVPLAGSSLPRDRGSTWQLKSRHPMNERTAQ